MNQSTGLMATAEVLITSWSGPGVGNGAGWIWRGEVVLEGIQAAWLVGWASWDVMVKMEGTVRLPEFSLS